MPAKIVGASTDAPGAAVRDDHAMARFMVTAMPFSGHVTPALAVAEALVARGHHVRFYTGAAFRERVEATGAANGKPMRLHGRFEARGERFYQVIVLGPADAAPPEQVEQFLSSFSAQ